MTDYPNLGFDPAPGDLGAIEAAISAGHDVAGVIHPVEKTFRPADSDKWVGAGSTGFNVVVAGVAVRLRKALTRQVALRNGLVHWHRQLTEMQEKARQLEQKASLARQQRDEAWQWAPTNVAEAKKMHEADAELRRVRAKAHDLLDDHQRAARAIARSIAG